MDPVSQPTQDIKSYRGICGWVMNLFGKTIRVINKENGNVRYYNKESLIDKLCQVAHCKKTETADRKALSTLMIEVLHPIKGKDVTIKKMNKIFKLVSEEFLNKPETSAKELSESLENLKSRKLKHLSLKEDELLTVLKPGDLFFKKNPEDADNIVVKAQRVFQHVSRQSITEREGYKYSHVAMYIGDGYIAESTAPDDQSELQVRMVKLEDSRFALHDPRKQYVVSRPADQALAAKAVEIACSIAKSAPPVGKPQANDNPHKYNKISAARSMLHTVSFGIFAKQRYFKQYTDHTQGDYAHDFMAHKSFYCSNFVAYCYQTAESLDVVPKIIGDSQPPQLKDRFLKAMCRGIWARVQRWKHLGELDQHVKMKFDAKWMTPHDMRNFVVSNPKVFKDMFVINEAHEAQV